MKIVKKPQIAALNIWFGRNVVRDGQIIWKLYFSLREQPIQSIFSSQKIDDRVISQTFWIICQHEHVATNKSNVGNFVKNAYFWKKLL